MIPLLALGCMPRITDVQQEIGEIPTVVTVSWWSPLAAEGALAYDTPGSGPQTVPAARVPEDGGYRYRATALGLRSSGTASATILLQDGDRARAEALELQAGRLALDLPALTLTDGAAPSAGFILTSYLRSPAAATILDGGGIPVWGLKSAREATVISEVHPDPAGGGVLISEYVHSDGPDDDGDDYILRVSLDGRQQDALPAPGLHHDFTPLPDGTIAYIADDFRTVDGALIHGDRIMERAPDGALAEVWSAWDTLAYTADTPARGDGWTHANALNYDPGDDAYYLSLHNYNSLVRIDRATGAIVWGLGGLLDDFGLSEEAAFARQHQFQLLGGGRILIFDNGLVDDGVTEVVELELDTAAMTAAVLWRYRSDDPVYTMVFGDVERLDSGETLISYSGSGRLEHLDPDGALVWRMDAQLGDLLGYTRHLPDAAALARP